MTKNANIPDIKTLRGFLIDMDGTLYIGEQPLPGSHPFIEFLQSEGISFYCLTNNSSQSALDYAGKLVRLGFKISQEQIITSGQIAANLLSQRHPQEAVFVVGTASLENEFTSLGVKLEAHEPAYIVVGFDTGLTYEKLSRLCTHVRQGIPYYATHPDFNCPSEEGPIPDIGATLAYVEASTGRRPDEIFGKPYPALAQVVLEKTGFQASELGMVGDRLYTDMAMGKHGLRTILVLSGETQRDDLFQAEQQPDWVFEGVGELLYALKEMRYSNS